MFMVFAPRNSMQVHKSISEALSIALWEFFRTVLIKISCKRNNGAAPSGEPLVVSSLRPSTIVPFVDQLQKMNDIERRNPMFMKLQEAAAPKKVLALFTAAMLGLGSSATPGF